MTVTKTRTQLIPLGQLRHNDYNARQTFNNIESLADDIEANGRVLPQSEVSK